MKSPFKRFYVNGDLRILGSPNLYGIWNTLMYKLHKLVNKKKKR